MASECFDSRRIGFISHIAPIRPLALPVLLEIIFSIININQPPLNPFKGCIFTPPLMGRAGLKLKQTKMKKYKFFALAFAAMTLGACSSEDVVDNGGQGSSVAPGEQGYVSLAINLPTQPGGTRIDEVYDGGTAAENDVKSAYLLLFSGASEDAATFQSAYELQDEASITPPDGVSSSYKYVSLITRPAGDNNLYALVVLNGGGNSGDAIEVGSDETTGWKFGGNALTAGSTQFSSLYSTALTLPLADVTGSDGFLMTNAPLYSKPGGSINPDGGTVQTLATVDEDYIYDSQAAAQAGVAAANVYVERAVAKVSVSDEGTTGGVGQIAYELKGYALDVTNNKTFLVRNVSGADWWGYMSTDASVTGENKYRFVGGDEVGTGFYRTYFGKDMNYNSNPVAGDMSIGGALTYDEKVKYCFENTFDVDHMKQNVTTHVVIAAVLSGLTGQSSDESTKGDFYTMYGDKSKLYDGIDDVTTQVLADYLADATIAPLIQGENVVAGQTVGAADFNVTYDTKASTGGYVKVIGVTVKDESKSKFKNNTVPVGLESNANVLASINNTLNIAYYKGGVSYYPVMIKHFGDGETPWKQSTTEPTISYPGQNKAQNWLGRYGVLRNNSYQITINKVVEIGYPETPPTYPGSYDDTVESWIGVTINMLPWVVRSQDVSLGE